MTHHTDAEQLHQLLELVLTELDRKAIPIAYMQEIDRKGKAFIEQAARRAPAAPSTWKDHDTAKLVNDLRDCAVQYHAAGQLRERIAHLVRPLAARLACAQAAPVPLRKPTVDQVSAEIGYHASAWDCVDPRELIDAILMLAAAPQPPEAGCSVSNGETQAAPVQLPEYGIDTANHAGIRVRGYTEQQVRELLAAHGIGKDKA